MKTSFRVVSVLAAALLAGHASASADVVGYQVSDLVVASNESATEILGELQAGESQGIEYRFRDVARRFNPDAFRTDHGLRFESADFYGPELAGAIRAATPSTIVGPVKTPDGWHLLMVMATHAYKSEADLRWHRRFNLAFDLRDRLKSGWSPVAESDDAVIFLRHEVSRRTDNLVTAWFLRSYIDPQTQGYGRRYRSEKVLFIVDCANHLYTNADSAAYANFDGTGDLVGTFPAAESEKLAAIVPDTVGEDIAKEMCRRAPATKASVGRQAPRRSTGTAATNL
jgi:hypothetical protein